MAFTKTEDDLGRQVRPVVTNESEDGTGTWHCLLSDTDGSLKVKDIYRGLAFVGTVTTATDTTHFKASALAGKGDNFFYGWEIYVLWDAVGAADAPQGEHKPCSGGYTSSDGTFIHAAFTTQLALTDKVLLVHPWLVANADWLNGGRLDLILDAINTNQGNPAAHTLVSTTAKIGNIARTLDLILGARWDGAGDLGTDILDILTQLGGVTGGIGAVYDGTTTSGGTTSRIMCTGIELKAVMGQLVLVKDDGVTWQPRKIVDVQTGYIDVAPTFINAVGAGVAFKLTGVRDASTRGSIYWDPTNLGVTDAAIADITELVGAPRVLAPTPAVCAAAPAEMSIPRFAVRFLATVGVFAGGCTTLSYNLKLNGASIGTGTLPASTATPIAVDVTTGFYTNGTNNVVTLELYVNAGSAAITSIVFNTIYGSAGTTYRTWATITTGNCQVFVHPRMTRYGTANASLYLSESGGGYFFISSGGITGGPITFNSIGGWPVRSGILVAGSAGAATDIVGLEEVNIARWA